MRLTSFALAAALITAPGLALAQSTLERVLGQIDSATNLAQVNGTFANIAENVARTPIPGVTTTEVTSIGLADAADDVRLWGLGPVTLITVADIGKTFTSGDGSAIGAVLATDTIDELTVNSDGSLSFTAANATTGIQLFNYSDGTSLLLVGLLTAETYELDPTGLVYERDGYLSLVGGSRAGFLSSLYTLQTQEITTTSGGTPGISSRIDGSITNIVTGVTAATAEAVAGSATATEFVMPTLDFGAMATTALGAVNTGDITLGVNSAVDEAATTTTRAVSSVMTQIGGSADTGALVLNVASNAGAINGSIQNIMTQVNGTIGDLSTTALGAVNTGTITTGVNSAVQGIVGMSGQTASGL